MRARLIANPKSGADRASLLLPSINERLRSMVSDLDITLTVDAHDAERAATRAIVDGCDALYVAGGDGTLNAVLRGVLAANALPLSVPIGVIPLGTGNDFAKALGLTEDPETALEALLAGRTMDVDVGLLNDRPFVNTSAGGFVADVSQEVTEELKDAMGKLAYLIGGARALMSTEPFPARVRMDSGPDGIDGTEESLELQMFAVCNARFIGGGYPIAPGALIDDGALDILLVPKMSKIDFLAVLQRIAAGDQDLPGVRRFRASAFEMHFGRNVRVNTDGEVLEIACCRYRVLQRGARFFCGEAPHAGG